MNLRLRIEAIPSFLLIKGTTEVDIEVEDEDEDLCVAVERGWLLVVPLTIVMGRAEVEEEEEEGWCGTVGSRW
jgi:hypothetical protein